MERRGPTRGPRRASVTGRPPCGVSLWSVAGLPPEGHGRCPHRTEPGAVRRREPQHGGTRRWSHGGTGIRHRRPLAERGGSPRRETPGRHPHRVRAGCHGTAVPGGGSRPGGHPPPCPPGAARASRPETSPRAPQAPAPNGARAARRRESRHGAAPWRGHGGTGIRHRTSPERDGAHQENPAGIRRREVSQAPAGTVPECGVTGPSRSTGCPGTGARRRRRSPPASRRRSPPRRARGPRRRG